MKAPTARQLRGNLTRGLGPLTPPHVCGAIYFPPDKTTVHTCGLPVHRDGRHCCGTWVALGSRRCGLVWDEHAHTHHRGGAP